MKLCLNWRGYAGKIVSDSRPQAAQPAPVHVHRSASGQPALTSWHSRGLSGSMPQCSFSRSTNCRIHSSICSCREERRQGGAGSGRVR